MSQESIALDPELREFRENMREKGIAVLRRLGNGGFGEIFIGRTEKDYAGRYVAIKRVVKERAVSSEADALDKYVARVHSQTNLVTVLGNWVFPNGELCYTMELADEANQKKPVERGASLDGYTPDTLLARREAAGSAFSLVEIDGFVQGLLAALALLEKLQLVHRDIKLPNIFFFSQQPVLGDL